MKKIITIAYLFVLSVVANAQIAEQWQQIYGGDGVEAGYSVKACLDQGYIVAGSTSTSGPSDAYLVRTDSLGLVMWSKSYGGVNIDVIRSIELLSDSGFIAAGYSNSFGNGGYDGWVLRLDKNGDTLWTRTFETNDWDFFYDVAVTSDSGFVLAGGTYGAGQGDEDMLFVKLDSLGNYEWWRTYGGLKQDEARSICVMPDSSFAACGWTYSLADTLGDSWIMNLSEINGDTLWATTAHFNTQADKAYGITSSSLFGLLYFCGNKETTPGNDDPYFNLWQFDGDSFLSATFGGADDEYFYNIVTRPEGTAAAVGTNYTVGAGAGDMMMFHTVNWVSTTYGTASLDEGFGIDVAHDGGYIMCGSTNGYGAFQSNVYLVKTDTFGVSTIVLAIREPVIADFTATVFPNPASESVVFTIDSESQIDEKITLNILDVTGRTIFVSNTSNQNRISSNCTQLTYDVSQLENGIYHYQITDESGISSGGSFVVSH